MQRRRVGHRCACGRRGGGGRRARSARGSPRPCRRSDIPGGISRSRKRPITSPWSVGLHLLARDDDSSRPAASSTVSSAPPKTLWSVTAIAPSPSATARSTSSVGWTAQSNDQDVCRCRSATIQAGRRAGRRPARGAPAPQQPSVEPVELGGEALEGLRLGLGARRRLLARCAGSGLRPVARRRRRRARAAARARRGCDRAAGRLRLEQHARRARSRPGTKIAVSREDRGARGAVARGADADAPGERARDRRTADERRRAQAAPPPSPGGRAARAAPPRAAARSFGRSSTVIAAPLARRGEELEVDAGRDDAVVAGEALRRGPGDRLGEREQRVETGEQPLALRAGRGVGEPVGRAEGRDRERARVAQGEVGERGEAGLEAVHDVGAEPARARARGSRARRPGRPSASAARSGARARPRRPRRRRRGPG